jgi:enoyl-CoA hydratase
MSSAPLVLAERDGAVLLLTLNRPEKRNALNAGLRAALRDALAKDRDDPETRVVVLKGAGDKAFAAGADVEEMAARDPWAQRAFITPPHIYGAVASHPKPVVAALNGHALGAGLELAMACDLRIASSAAKLGQPEINLGIIPGGGGTQRLPRLVGAGRAARMVLTGDSIDAQTALAWGLVEEVAEPEKVVARAVEIAKTMATKSPVALRLAKEALRAAEELPLGESLGREIDLFTLAFQSQEAQAGIKAFVEKAKAP